MSGPERGLADPVPEAPSSTAEAAGVADEPDGAPGPVRRTGVAGAVTEVLAPANLVVAQLLLVGWHAAGPRGLGWGVLAAVFCGVIPYAIVLAGVRRGRLGDRHVRSRRQRPVPLLAATASIAAGLAALAALGAPRQLVTLAVAMLAGLAVMLAVTLWWKISIHTTVAAATVTALAILVGVPALATAPVVAVVGWSRVRLRDHTVTQVVAGAATGAATAAAVLLALPHT